MNYVDELLLVDFAPFIQLWAGICLLFFYQNLLEKSPLDSYRNEIQSLYGDFVMKYINFLPQNLFPKAEEYIEDKWKDLRPTINNIAILSFFYATFILIYIGLEVYTPCKLKYQVLQVLNSVVWLYMFLAIIFIKWKIFHKVRTPIIVIGGLITYFHVYSFVDNWLISREWCIGLYLSRTVITTFTLFTCIGGVPLILMRIFWSFCSLSKTKKMIKQADNTFSALVSVYMGEKEVKDISPKLGKRIAKKMVNEIIKGGDPTSMLNHYVRKEIIERFFILITPWWIRVERKLSDGGRAIYRMFRRRKHKK